MPDTGKKMILMLLGALIIFMGIVPFLANAGYLTNSLNFIPAEGTTYNVLIIILGILVIFTSRKIY